LSGIRCPYCGRLIEWRLIWLRNILTVLAAVFIFGYTIHFVKNTFSSKEEKRYYRIQKTTKEKNQTDFNKTINHHYQRLVNFYETNNYNQVIKKLHWFKKHNLKKYKNVHQIREQTISHLDQIVRKIPVSEVLKNLKIYQQLLDLDPRNSKYKRKVAFYRKRAK